MTPSEMYLTEKYFEAPKGLLEYSLNSEAN
jgi:hypothetical protein